MAKRANSSNSWKSRSMVRLGCKRPAGTRKFGGTSGTRAICLPHQTEQVTTNGDNKGKPPNITDTHPNHIPYTPTLPQTQTSELDYIIHDNKKGTHHGHFQNDKSNNTINQNHRRQHGEKGHEKRPNKKMNGNFIFDERTYFNKLDQSTPLSDNYKNSEICKH